MSQDGDIYVIDRAMRRCIEGPSRTVTGTGPNRRERYTLPSTDAGSGRQRHQTWTRARAYTRPPIAPPTVAPSSASANSGLLVGHGGNFTSTSSAMRQPPRHYGSAAQARPNSVRVRAERTSHPTLANLRGQPYSPRRGVLVASHSPIASGVSTSLFRRREARNQSANHFSDARRQTQRHRVNGIWRTDRAGVN
jgi:hypothetical protein